jgi:hypothetical protein
MMNNNFSEFEGVIEYDALMGMSPMTNNPFDADNFYDMDGRRCGCGRCPMCERQSNVLGGILPTRADLERNRKRRQARRTAKTDARIRRRDARANTKLTQADASRIAAQSLGKESASDIALAQALATPIGGATEKKGLSKNAKIGIAVGSVLLLGVIGFLVYKKVSKK